MSKKIGLLNELIRRFELDQELSRKKEFGKLEEIYRSNSSWLKNIVLKDGWPSAESVTKRGENCVWLITQHSDDLGFQKYCLNLLSKLNPTKERKQSIAFLTDRILVNENQKQIYGTQFSNGKPLPIQDYQNLDKMRKKMGLESFNEYQERMGAY